MSDLFAEKGALNMLYKSRMSKKGFVPADDIVKGQPENFSLSFDYSNGDMKDLDKAVQKDVDEQRQRDKDLKSSGS